MTARHPLLHVDTVLPLHLAPTVNAGGQRVVLVVVLACTLVLAAVLVALSIVAFLRRQTRSTLFIAAAFATVLGHALVALLMLGGVVSGAVHHLVEHVLVVVQSGLVLAAIYYARTVERRYRDTGDSK